MRNTAVIVFFFQAHVVVCLQMTLHIGDQPVLLLQTTIKWKPSVHYLCIQTEYNINFKTLCDDFILVVNLFIHFTVQILA